MVFHMKTTLIIDDGVMRRLKEAAARRGTTISELVDTALRLFLEPKDRAATNPPLLPTWNFGGPPLVDIADREALHRVIDADRDAVFLEDGTERRP